MCKKHSSVLHSSTEAEIISLDAGLRMDGIPALTLWDFVIDILHSVLNKIEQPKEELRGNPSQATKPNMPTASTSSTPTSFQQTLDHIPPNTVHSGARAMLYVIEDSEAVIKMMIKGRSPTMGHVSWTHRVAPDWFFDRINLDPKIEIRYIGTKHQLADMLTKGKFKRDELNNLLHLFNICHFSSLRCQNFNLISCTTKAKRIQEPKEGERIASKSRLAMNVSSFLIATSSSAASSPIASISPGQALKIPDSKAAVEKRMGKI